MGHPFLVIGIVCLIVLYTFSQYIFELVLLIIRTPSIPGPQGIPIFGLLLTFSKLRVQDQVHYLLDVTRKYKDGLCKAWIGPSVLIIVTMPSHIEKILSSSVNIVKNKPYDILKPLLGEGLLTSKGQEWFHDRKLLTPIMHFSVLKEYVPAMNEKCQVMIECIERKMKESPEQPVEIYSRRKTSWIVLFSVFILATLMGIDIQAQGQEIEYTEALHKLSEISYERMCRPWFIWKWMYMLTSRGRQFYAYLGVIDRFTREVIRKRLEWRKIHGSERKNDNTTDETGRKRKKALLDHLLDLSENSIIQLSEEKIRQQVDTFMAAGHDTTSAAITWALFCLGNSMEHQEKVHEELDAVFGDSERPPSLNDLAQLRYLDRVLKESLRMYPPAPIIARQLSEDVDIGEYIIPKGAGVLISPMGTHRHPDVWENPEKFDPDRFLPENIKNQHPYAYIPFSAGPRNCIGQKFAKIELKIMAAYILRKWKVNSDLRHDQVEMSLPIVLKPLNGIHLYLTPRK